MIPLPKFKELLGEEAVGMTDEEIERLRNDQYAFAQLAFEKWRQEKLKINTTK